jgi:acetyl esterase
MPPRRSRLLAIAAIGMATAAVLAGCGPTGDDSEQVTPQIVAVNPELATLPDIPVVEDLAYGEADGQPLLLDACLPKEDAESEQTPTPAPSETSPDDAATATPEPEPSETADEVDAEPDDPARAAIIVVHGGSWSRGDKADVAWRAVCQWFASAGYPTFSVNYRLAPAAPFPAGFGDVQTAVRWLREPAQLERFDIDPERIGAFGGSAGGNLVSLLGTAGKGDLTSGVRVAAVADLSGPIDLTGVAVTDDFVPVQLAYLACTDLDDCPVADDASPNYAVDPSDPPFFVAHSTVEKIPLEQSELFVRALRDAGIDTEFITVEGTLHSIAMLDADLKQRIIAFFDEKLAPAPPVVE